MHRPKITLFFFLFSPPPPLSVSLLSAVWQSYFKNLQWVAVESAFWIGKPHLFPCFGTQKHIGTGMSPDYLSLEHEGDYVCHVLCESLGVAPRDSDSLGHDSVQTVLENQIKNRIKVWKQPVIKVYTSVLVSHSLKNIYSLAVKVSTLNRGFPPTSSVVSLYIWGVAHSVTIVPFFVTYSSPIGCQKSNPLRCGCCFFLSEVTGVL